MLTNSLRRATSSHVGIVDASKKGDWTGPLAESKEKAVKPSFGEPVLLFAKSLSPWARRFASPLSSAKTRISGNG